MRFHLKQAVAAATALLGACVMFGCGVGHGNRPIQLFLGTTAIEQSAQMPECTQLALNAYVLFSDGKNETTGTYNNRVTWTSQDPSVAFVSDGVTLSPDGKLYEAGTVIGLRPGVATITSTYLDLQTAIAVDVTELSNLRIDNLHFGTDDVQLTDIGEQLQQRFLLEATEQPGAPETDITTSAQWRFDPTTTHAFVGDSTGLVQANSSTDGQELTLVARLPECAREVTRQFRVSPVTSLNINYFERGNATALPIGFSEAFIVNAGFADPQAPQQNVSTQTTISAIDGDYISAALGTDAYYVTALNQVGSGKLTLSLNTATPTSQQPLTLTSKTWQIQDTDLVSLALAPEDHDEVIHYPAMGQLTVSGTFDNGLVMPITREVSWGTTDPTLGNVSSAFDTAGQVTITNTDGDFEATASYTINGNVLDDFVTIHAFANTD